jgi:hypothetical protein
LTVPFKINRLRLASSVNDFSKFTKHFWSNRNHFPVDYYFRPYQNRKMPKSFCRNHFTPKQTEHKLKKKG